MLDRSQAEEIEGIDDDTDHSLGDYPIDDLHIQKDHRTIFEVKRRIDQKNYILNPDFQRDFVWDHIKQSRLIESCLMRIPLPVFYLAETADGKVVVVDGLQRLSTFRNYLDNKFPLTIYENSGKKDANHPLAGKKFKDLPPKLQNRLEDTQLVLYIISSNVKERAKLDIFERVNSGQPLTRQQMRHALYSGKATTWLHQESEAKEFRDATDNSLDNKSMRDREIINRFCSFRILGYENFNEQMDEFLANGLKQMNEMNQQQLAQLSMDFRKSMLNNYGAFGIQAFRKMKPSHEKRSIFNVALFDVFSVLLTQYETSEVSAKSATLAEELQLLLKQNEFWECISRGTNTPSRVRTRFSMAKQMLEKVFHETHTTELTTL